MIRIQTKFIGTNSLGFVNGHDYTLSIKPSSTNGLEIQSLSPNGQACIYQSWEAFKRNWRIKDINTNDLNEGSKLFSNTPHTLFDNLKTELRNIKLIRIIE